MPSGLALLTCGDAAVYLTEHPSVEHLEQHLNGTESTAAAAAAAATAPTTETHSSTDTPAVMYAA
jgi:hypothetical protein